MSKVSDVPVTEEDTGKGGRRRYRTDWTSFIWVQGEQSCNCHPTGWAWESGCMVKNCMTVILADGELLKARCMILDFKG